jgi:hypothetical protein
MGYRPDSRTNMFDNSSINDYTQANSFKNTVKRNTKSNYSAF